MTMQHEVTNRGAVAADLDQASVMHPFASISDHQRGTPLMIVRGEGVHLFDSTGRRYLDGAAGLWCVNIGHGNRRVADAIARQAQQLAFTHSFGMFANEPAARLGARILELAEGRFSRVFFGTSGSDANETNIKLAWYYNNMRGKPRKKKIISRLRGYHGVTVLSGSLTALDNVHRHFDLPTDVARYTDTPDCYLSPEIRGGMSQLDYSRLLADRLAALIEKEGPDTVAAFIAEPVMGVAGVLPPPEGYFAAIAEVLQRYDVLMIADEVITGFGRLGSWFGMQHYGFTPDLMTVAKGLTSGYQPLSAALIGPRVWDVLRDASGKAGPIGHGFTYSGHPVCTAAALANLDVLTDDNLVTQAGARGRFLAEVFERTFRGRPFVGDVRVVGLLGAIELSCDGAAFPPDRKLGVEIARECLARGVIVRALHPGDVVACSPPFIVSESEIEQIASTLSAALETVTARLGARGQ